MNLSVKMMELVNYFKSNGFGGMRVPLEPEMEEVWSDKYAICCGYYYEPQGLNEMSEYFDRSHFEYDLKQFIKEWFGKGVKITFYEGSQELMVQKQ